MLPITGLMLIRLKYNELTLVTTDTNNYLYVIEKSVTGDDFYVVVQADVFSKLISRMTSSTTTLELVDGNLVVTGNGKYTIDLPLDESGELIKFPDPVADIVFDTEPSKLNLSTFKLLLDVNKPALATSADLPYYTGYYASEGGVVSTDSYVMCGTSIKLFDKTVLINPEMIDMFEVMMSEEVDGYVFESETGVETIVFKTPDCTIYGKAMADKDKYQIDAINSLLGSSFPSKCSISKSELLQVLDRLALFVGPYDMGGIYLTFTKEGIMLSSKKSNGTELISYKTSESFADFSCCINLDMLTRMVKSHAVDELEFEYGTDNALKIVDGNVTQIIAYEVDDR